MEKMKRAGILKSWSCVAMLTFVVPAAGVELSNILVAASIHAGHSIAVYLEPAAGVPRPPLQSCQDYEVADTI